MLSAWLSTVPSASVQDHIVNALNNLSARRLSTEAAAMRDTVLRCGWWW
jgi:hypothetical protein